MHDTPIPQAASFSAFDRVAALRAVDGNEPLLRQVAEVFLNHHTAVCSQIDQAVGDGAHGQLREIAHDLKGMGASIGAQALSAAARTLETVAAFGASPDLDEALAALQRELQQVRAVMSQIARG